MSRASRGRDAEWLVSQRSDANPSSAKGPVSHGSSGVQSASVNISNTMMHAVIPPRSLTAIHSPHPGGETVEAVMR